MDNYLKLNLGQIKILTVTPAFGAESPKIRRPQGEARGTAGG